MEYMRHERIRNYLGVGEATKEAVCMAGGGEHHRV